MKFTLPKFDYYETCLEDLKVDYVRNKKDKDVEYVLLDGSLRTAPSGRFWTSLCSRFGLSTSVFRWFNHEEVFNRIAGKMQKTKINVTLERTPNQACPKLLAMHLPDKNVIHYNELVPALTNGKTKATNVEYTEGVIVSSHDLRRSFTFDVGGDEHRTRILLETPIDGYGKPTLYLSMFRNNCSNEVIARSKMFQSGIILGKGAAGYTVQRAIESFSNEDGFVALKDRLKASQKAWASAFETVQLARVLWSFNDSMFKEEFARTLRPTLVLDSYVLRNRLLERLYKISGDLRDVYGVAQLDSISEKRLRVIPARCTVYELITFASEIATYQIKPENARALQSFIGSIISEEFDLENSCTVFRKFEDFFDSQSKVAKEAVEASGGRVLEL